MMGSTDASAYFQAGVAEILGGLLGSCCALWIDDLLIYAKSKSELVVSLGAVLTRLDRAGIKVDPTKCVLFSEKVKWCGKIFSSAGVSHDPERISGLLDMQPPQTLGQLQQFIGAVNWMRQHIPMFARLAKPLQNLLNAGLSKLPKRTKKYATAVALQDAGWNESHSVAYQDLLTALREAVTLAHPEPDYE